MLRWRGPGKVHMMCLGSPPALSVPLVDLGHQSRAEAVPWRGPGGVHTDDPLPCGNHRRALPAGVQLWARQGMLVCVGKGLGFLFLHYIVPREEPYKAPVFPPMP